MGGEAQVFGETPQRIALRTVAQNRQASVHAPLSAERDGPDGNIETVEKCQRAVVDKLERDCCVSRRRGSVAEIRWVGSVMKHDAALRPTDRSSRQIGRASCRVKVQ